MTARFADTAQRLSGLAGQALGWTPDIFWNATPAELAAILSPLAAEAPLGRAALNRMMEQDHD